VAKTKTVAGQDLHASDFAYVGDPDDPGTWSLPVHDKDHVQNALARFNQTDVPAAKKQAVAKKLASKARSVGIDPSGFEKENVKSDEHAEAHDYAGGWIEIFRAGDYGDQGKAKVTRSDLVRVVNDYDPEYHEAPECIGHPADNLPAYGWVDRLKLDGDVLLMKETQVDPEFADMRGAGKFKKRSAAFYRDANGDISGLRHVAWLGAQPPAVKGLKNLNFNDADREFVEFEFAQEETVEKPIKEQIAEFFAELFNGKKTPAEFSEAAVQSIVTKAVDAATKPLTEKIAKLETDHTAQTAKFSERETRIAQGETRQRATEAVVKLKGSGHWVPAFEKQGLPLVFDELAKITTTVEFGEGDAKKKVAPLEILVQFLEGLPKMVPSGRVAAGAPTGQGKSTGDPLTDLAKARAAEKKISFSEALTQVAEENPELTVPGGAHAGAV
jgi:hypothetical protein